VAHAPDAFNGPWYTDYIALVSSPQPLLPHPETPVPVRLAQQVRAGVYLTLLLVSLAAAVAALFLPVKVAAVAGPLASTLAALSAVGFVLHDRPRVMVVRAQDIDWDQSAADLPGFGYSSQAGGVWRINASTHKKGPYPVVSVLFRASAGQPWLLGQPGVRVNESGDLFIDLDLERTSVDDPNELAVIVR